MRRKKKNMACSSFHVTYNEQETGCVLIPTGASSFYPRIVHAECQLIPLKQEMAMYRLGVRESFSVCLTLTRTHTHTQTMLEKPPSGIQVQRGDERVSSING